MSARSMMQNLVLAACGVALAAPALAQSRQAVPAPDPQVAARYQLAIMADVLERAVQQGARLVTAQWQSAMPQLLMGGPARARGFRLDGYGVFFDVDVPAMRQSMVWSWRMLDLTNDGAVGAIEALKAHLATVSDPTQRRDLDQAIRQLELQIGPFSSPSEFVRAEGGARRQGQATVVTLPKPDARAEAPAAVQGRPAPLSEKDPGELYTTAVKDALIDAMLRYSQSLSVAPDEWLVVAARDRGDIGLGADDPSDVTTIQLRIKGADLQALHAGRLTPDEARKRVEVREY